MGQTILDPASFTIAQNPKPSGTLQNLLNAAQVGAFGYSQGATGVINAMKKSAGIIKTVMPIELPAPIFCSMPQNCADASTLTANYSPDLAPLLISSFHKICRNMPRRSSASPSERFRRRTNRRIFSSASPAGRDSVLRK